YNTTATIEGDCDDGDPNAWASGLAYKDEDLDGYTVGSPIPLCHGSVFLPGYSLTTLGEDCNDHDQNLHTAQTWYLDADNDGHYVSSIASCGRPGTGYNTTATIEGDCDD